MKVFLDTNVLASAAATRGLCADVLRQVFASQQLFISEQVLKELERVLRFKFGVGQVFIDDFIWLLQQDTILAEPAKLPKVELRDKDDLPILAAAIAVGAEVLVTGDKELLDLGHIEGLEILSPRQFWEKLKAQQQRRAGRGKPRRSR
ncbi:MAG: putative toxin-antitoxin system toxin component, PIN family [Planctomycetes bacterium RBG_16_55_9]|nr:MAG: putative toxin-antitoxin system toxin component, PIN family [Planctomycetes bacterium RBG_16_55_9]